MHQPPASHRVNLVRVVFLGALAFSYLESHRPPTAPPPELAESGLKFREVAAELGIEFEHRTPELDPQLAHIHPQIVGTGAAVSAVDFDGDGHLDLYATTMADGAANGLFRNLGNEQFEDVAAEVGLADLNREGEGVSHGSLWADVDRDGDQDVLVYKWGRSQLLLQGEDGRFTDVTGAAGLGHWMHCTAALWFDYDRDGWLDLYMGGYYREDTNLWDVESTRVLHNDGEFATNGGRNFLFRGLGLSENGAPLFEEVGEEMGVAGFRWTYGVGSADFNRDGWPDLYVANDYGTEELFFNREGKAFELAEGLGLDAKSKSGMCVSIGDVTNRGQLAVFVTNITESRWLHQGNNLRVSLMPKSHRMMNLSQSGHTAQDCGWAWGADFGDLDNDGDQDLVVVNGFRSADPERSYWYQMDKLGGATGALLEDAALWPAYGEMSLSGFQRTRTMLNTGRGQMIEVGRSIGIDDVLDGRAVVMADLFNDGTLDVVCANQSGPLLVYRNMTAAAGNWIGFELRGSEGHPDAIGAEVIARFGEVTQVQVVTAGSGFCSQTDRRVHFGLGDEARPERIEIRWPSGQTQELDPAQLAPGQYHLIEEPEA